MTQKQEFNGTPVEKELLFAIMMLNEACEALKGKPEDWQRLGRARYIAQTAIDNCLKPEITHAVTSVPPKPVIPVSR